MAQETEAKFYVLHLDAIQQRVESLGAARVAERVHELNLRFDTPTRDMRRRGRVLRLRLDTRARLTYKDSERMQRGTLSRREVEVTVSDFDTTRELLEALGYELVFIYEKYRTTYTLDGGEIVLDELPYGNFVEIEADDDKLQPIAEKLGLRWDTVIRDSYSTLFDHLPDALTSLFRDLTFDNFASKTVSAEDLGLTPADG